MDDVIRDLNLYKTQLGLIAAKTIKPKAIAIKGNPKTLALNEFLGKQRKYAPTNIINPITSKRLPYFINRFFNPGQKTIIPAMLMPTKSPSNLVCVE